MKISFVIPAYNEEHYVERCLRSVMRELQRESVEAEIIVVDNNSSDATRDVALGIPGVTVIHESKKGVAHARNTGFFASSGDIVAYLDADCELPEGWLSTLVHEFQDERIAALSGPCKYPELPALKRALVSGFYVVAYGMYLLNHRLLHVGAMLQGGNFAVRREALARCGGFNTAIPFWGDDTDVARRLGEIGRVKWTWSFPIHTSARRFEAEGLALVGWRYALNFFWTTFAKRPFTMGYIDVRSE